MNTYHTLNAINSVQVKNLTNEAYKYISEFIIGILFRDIKTMLLDGLTDTFEQKSDTEATGISRRDALRAMLGGVATAALASAPFGKEAEASESSWGAIQRYVYDMHGAQLLGIRGIAAETSAGRVAIAAYGDDQAFLDAIGNAVLYHRREGRFAELPGDPLPVDVVWADNTHSNGRNAIDVYIDGYRILPGKDQPPFAIKSDANDVAKAVVRSFNHWKSLAQAPGPRPAEG